MTDDRVKEYIKEQLKRGSSLSQIKTSLINAGWSPSKIEEHIKELSPKSPINLKIIILLLLFFIIFISYFVYLSIFDINRKIQSFANRGDILCSKGKYQEAHAEFDKAIKINQTKSIGYYYKGKCYVSMDKYEEAIQQLNKAIQLTRKNPNYYFYLGLSYCEISNYENGIANLNKAINLSYNIEEVYEVMSKCQAIKE